EAGVERAVVHPADGYAAHGAYLRFDHVIYSPDDVQADAIVLATGARPREFPGASTFRTLDDSLALRARAGGAKTAVVIGGGFIGCELTASLKHLGVKVTHVVRDAMGFAAVPAPPLP